MDPVREIELSFCRMENQYLKSRIQEMRVENPPAVGVEELVKEIGASLSIEDPTIDSIRARCEALKSLIAERDRVIDILMAQVISLS